MGTILSIVNQKGGVGKTTLSFNLAGALKSLGHKILIVDNDPQGNLSSYADVGGSLSPRLTIDEVYVSRRSQPLEKKDLVTIDDTLSILPSDSMLAGVEYYLTTRSDKEYVLKNALQKLKDEFDFILIDNPPALNLLTVNGLIASQGVLVPVQLEFFSLEGIVALEKTIESLKDKNPTLKIIGIVPNMFDDRRKLNWEVLEALKESFGEKVLNTKIHNCVKIAESSGHGKSILSYSPKSRSSQEFLQIAEEIITHV